MFSLRSRLGNSPKEEGETEGEIEGEMEGEIEEGEMETWELQVHNTAHQLSQGTPIQVSKTGTSLQKLQAFVPI